MQFHTLNKYLYPFALTGNFFNLTKIETMTQLSDGSADAYIFFDRLEVELHKKIYKNTRRSNSIMPGTIFLDSQKV